MSFEVIEPGALVPGPIFKQDEFLNAVRDHNWEQYRGKKVLVRGCGDQLTPPWAYMAITARLAGLAASVRYGNEHDNVTVYRAPKTSGTESKQRA